MKNKTLLGLISTLALAWLGAVAVAFFVTFRYLPIDSRPELIFAVVRAFLQLAVITITGGAVKLIYDQIAEQRREDEKAREKYVQRLLAKKDLRTSQYNDLGEVYLELRRKWRLTQTSRAVPYVKYGDFLRNLEDLRDDLDRISLKLDFSPALFTHYDLVKKCIDEVVSFTDKAHWERVSILKSDETQSVQDLDEEELLERLPHYAELRKNYERKLAEPLQKAAILMQVDILGSKHDG